jgi:hypothetical protein
MLNENASTLPKHELIATILDEKYVGEINARQRCT